MSRANVALILTAALCCFCPAYGMRRAPQRQTVHSPQSNSNLRTKDAIAPLKQFLLRSSPLASHLAPLSSSPRGAARSAALQTRHHASHIILQDGIETLPERRRDRTELGMSSPGPSTRNASKSKATLLTREQERRLGRKVQVLKRLEAKLEELQLAKFQLIDCNRDGCISLEEAELAGISKEAFTRMDKDKSGTIERDEFVDAAKNKHRESGSSPMLYVGEASKEEWAAACGINETSYFIDLVVSCWAARQELILRNIGLINWSIKKANFKYTNEITYEDVHQECIFALSSAIDKWDPERGVKLSTFANYVLMGQIREIKANSGPIRLTMRRLNEIRVVIQAEESLKQRLGRSPTEEEIAEEAGTSVNKLKDLRRYGALRNQKNMLYYDQYDWDVMESSMQNQKALITEELEESMVREKVKSIVSAFPTLEATVLNLRFGLDDDSRKTVPQIEDIIVKKQLGKHGDGKKALYRAMKLLRTPRHYKELKGLADLPDNSAPSR